MGSRRKPFYTDIMVPMLALAALLHLVWGGAVHYPMMQANVQMNGVLQMQNMMQQQMMQQQMMQQHHEQQGQNNGNWWNLQSDEDREAYLKWCEERKIQMQEQEESQRLLRQITEQAEEKKREMAREKMMKEARAKRESMVAQWRMWQNQIKQAEEYTGNMDKYQTMKTKYMFSLTMDYLKFCRCSDYTAPLQRYLSYDGMTYEPGMSEAYTLDELEGIDITNEEAVAQRMATLSDEDDIKLFFHGIITTTCESVKAYVKQLQTWESQYNFMGH